MLLHLCVKNQFWIWHRPVISTIETTLTFSGFKLWVRLDSDTVALSWSHICFEQRAASMALGVFGCLYTWLYTAREDVGPVWVHVRLFVAFLGPWRQFGQRLILLAKNLVMRHLPQSWYLFKCLSPSGPIDVVFTTSTEATASFPPLLLYCRHNVPNDPADLAEGPTQY